MTQATGAAGLQQAPFPLPATLLDGNVVVLGGGTGLSTLLQGLQPICFSSADRNLTEEQKKRLTAIVTVSDDGGSSGALRQAYPILAPGDIRNCLLALADCDPQMQALFDFRFNGDVGGHSLGNLIITALSQLESDFTSAVEQASKILDIRGRVLPATPDDVVIEAEFSDGSLVRGESAITSTPGRIEQVFLRPGHVATLPAASSAIAEADMIVIGPGSLYTSLIPTLLVPGIAQAIANSHAKVVLVMNIMSEPGETDDYGISDFLRAIARHAPGVPIHSILMNNGHISPQQQDRYAQQGATPIGTKFGKIADLKCELAFRNLLANGDKIRHDPAKLGKAILDIAL